MKTFRVTAIQTDKAPEEWPLVTIELIVLAPDEDWAEQIAVETIGMAEIHRGAYGAMKVDEVTEITVAGI